MTDDSKLTMLGISILTCKIRLKFETDDFKVLVLAIFVSSFFGHPCSRRQKDLACHSG